MKIRLWGVRGSIPCPGPDTVKYGGNTPCIEVFFEEIGRRIIIDAGSGIRNLGKQMIKKGELYPIEIFLTHTHWDHIMGFPFFAPMYVKGVDIRIYGPKSSSKESLKEIVGGQWTHNYFPVLYEDLAADVEYIELEEGEYDLGNSLRLKTKKLIHPVSCYGYRFEYKGKVLCTVYDTEPFNEEEEIVSFIKDADLLIHDSQYTKEEYEKKKGWGHSFIEYVIEIGKKAKVKKIIFFHHDPERTDKQLDELSKKYRGKEIDCFFAKEGEEFFL